MTRRPPISTLFPYQPLFRSPRVPVWRTRSDMSGRSASRSRNAAAARRDAPSQSGPSAALIRGHTTKVPVALTAAQREAVTHPGGPLLVVAGAGTGKTTVLVERFAWLAQTVPPESILMLTFSAAAADALRERLEDRLAEPYEELTVTTFHGFCGQLLHDEALEAGIDPFATPVTAADRLAMLLERIDDLPLR